MQPPPQPRAGVSDRAGSTRRAEWLGPRKEGPRRWLSSKQPSSPASVRRHQRRAASASVSSHSLSRV
eukprot:1471513-Rhodomonas_salina.2